MQWVPGIQLEWVHFENKNKNGIVGMNEKIQYWIDIAEYDFELWKMQRDCSKNRGVISMDKEKVIERVKQYSDLVRQNFSVKKIILYGSYNKGSARKDSDIDVAVVLSSIDEDFLMSESKLFRLRRNIDARIEPILLEEKNDKSGFLEEILKTGEIIYSAD